MVWWLILAVILFLACAVLIIAEVLLPSGGILSIASLICLVSGIVILFKHSTATGIVGVVVALIMIPAVIIVTYRILPKTKLGQSVFLRPPDRHKGDAIPDTDALADILGKTGNVISPLRPVGMVDFQGSRLECVAETGYVENDKVVKVIKVEGTQLTVRIVEEA